MSNITVLKLDHRGQETWRYTGKLVEKSDNHVLLEATFNRPDTPFHGILLRRGDRFIETFYSDRWYNIFEIHDLENDRLKGWYCNIGYPAKFEEDSLSYIDLALDLLVYPDGRQLVLDEDEFYELPLSPQARINAKAALQELQSLFKEKVKGQV